MNYGQSADIFLGFNSANPRILLQDNSNIITHDFTSNANNYIVGSNLGIGTTSPVASYDRTLHIKGVNPTLRIETNNSSGWAYHQFVSPEGIWSAGIDDGEKYVITNHSTLGSGHVKFSLNTSGNANFSGSVTSADDIIAYSDKKLKKNIKTLDGSKVYKMRGVSFTRKDTGKDSSGVIAQEIQKVAPELVNETEETLGVAYGNLTGYLIEAVKELKAEIEELKKQIK